MKVVFGVCLLIFILLAFPIKLKAKIDYNILKNKGIMTFFIFSFNIKPQAWQLGMNKFILHNDDKPDHAITLFKGGGNTEYTDYLIFEMLKIINIHTVKVFATIGIENNPMATALICSSITIPTKITFGVVKGTKQNTKVVSQILPSYIEDKASIAFNCSISLNLLMVCFALISASKKQKREKQEYGKQSN